MSSGEAGAQHVRPPLTCNGRLSRRCPPQTEHRCVFRVGLTSVTSGIKRPRTYGMNKPGLVKECTGCKCQQQHARLGPRTFKSYSIGMGSTSCKDTTFRSWMYRHLPINGKNGPKYAISNFLFRTQIPYVFVLWAIFRISVNLFSVFFVFGLIFVLGLCLEPRTFLIRVERQESPLPGPSKEEIRKQSFPQDRGSLGMVHGLS